MNREGFTERHRLLGRISCWGALIIGLAYTVFQVLHKLYDPTTVQASFADPYLPIASILLVPIAALMIASMVAVHAYASRVDRPFSLLSLAFMTLGMGSTTLLNFGLYIVVTHQAEMAGAPWLSLFIPIKRPGLYGELDLLNWSWFFGLSMIAAAPVFREGALERAIRALMYATGILPIVGWIIMVFVPSAYWPGWILQALGWGVLILVVWFLMARLFDRPLEPPEPREEE